MDVWVEFKNASKWQAELLFRNFFPCTDEDVDEATLDAELDGVDLQLPVPPTPSSPAPSSGRGSLFSALLPSASSSSLSSLPSTLSSSPSSKPEPAPPLAPGEEHAIRHAAAPLSNAKLAELGRRFGEAIPDEEFSVAALQGCEFLPHFVIVV